MNQSRYYYKIKKDILILGDNYNKKLSKFLINKIREKNILTIRFGKIFNKSIDNLPNGVENLIFDSDFFNNSVDNLPSTVKKLIFKQAFNRSIDFLPEGLTYLKLGWDFEQKLDNLPESLEYLDVGGSFNEHLNNLPENLKILVLGIYFNSDVKFPKNIENIYHPKVIKIG